MQEATLEQILKILQKENFKIPVFLLGIALLGRSFATINPEYGITIFGPEAQPQDILAYFDINVDKYIMTMLWPLVYALLNSLHPGIRIGKPYFNTIIIAHILSLVISLIWYFFYIPNGQEDSPRLEEGLNFYRFQACIIFSVATMSSLFSLFWYSKRWMIFEEVNDKEGAGA